MDEKFAAVIVIRNSTNYKVNKAYSHKHLTEELLRKIIGEEFTYYEGDWEYEICVYRTVGDVIEAINLYNQADYGHVIRVGDDHLYESQF